MYSINVYNCDNPKGIFYLDQFMEWLEDNYNGFDNSLPREITRNAICYILNFGDDSHYIEEINYLFNYEIDSLPFFRDESLTYYGIKEKRKFWKENHPSWWDKKEDDADYWFSFV